MIKFNELYITDDGKHLVVDVQIEDLPVYEYCFIDDVKVSISSDCDAEEPVGAISLFTGPTATAFSYEDLIELLNSILDGVVQQSGLSEEIKEMLDVNHDGEINISDINNVISRILAGNTDDIPTYTRRFRRCLSAADLVPLVDAKEKDLSKYIFKVDVHAVVVYNSGSLAEYDCDLSINTASGVAFNGQPVYDAALKYAAALGSEGCDGSAAKYFEDFILRYYAFVYAIQCGDFCTAYSYWKNYLVGGGAKVGSTSSGCGCHGIR